MAITATTVFQPWPADYPVPYDAVTPEILATRGLYGKLFVESSWAGGVGSRGIIALQRGSGSTEEPVVNTFITRCINNGFAVLVWSFPGYWISPPSFYRYGYGNVNSPMFTGHLIKDAWTTQTMLDYLDANYPDNPIVLVGHSRGAAAQVAWNAGLTGRTLQTRVRGVLAMGATMGGLGDLSWNDMMRNLNTISGLINLSTKRLLLAYGDEDTYAPTDYVHRLQIAIDITKDVFVLSPGAMPHVWYTSDPGASYAAEWARQLMAQVTILDRNGAPAKRGPVASVQPPPPPAVLTAGFAEIGVGLTLVGHTELISTTPPSSISGNLFPPGQDVVVNLLGYIPENEQFAVQLTGAGVGPFMAGKRIRINGVIHDLTVPTPQLNVYVGHFFTSEPTFVVGESYEVEMV